MKRINAWKNWLKTLWARRPRLGRGGKTVRNLLLSLLLALPLWWLAGYPLFFPRLEFRRLERENLLPRGEIVFSLAPSFGGTAALEWNGETLDCGERLRYVSASEDWAAMYTASKLDSTLQVYPRGEGPDPLPFLGGWSTLLGPEDLRGGGAAYNFYCPILLLDVPSGTARAELEVDVTADGASFPWTGEGRDWGGGAWLFLLSEEEDRGYSNVMFDNAPFTLRTCGPDGALLETFRGIVPEAG